MAEKRRLTKAQKEAVTRYKQKAYDKVELRLPKGERDTLNAHAKSMGESTNAFLLRAIAETTERDKEADNDR